MVIQHERASCMPACWIKIHPPQSSPLTTATCVKLHMLHPLVAQIMGAMLEVYGTMLLPVSQNFTRPLPTLSLIGCYAASFYCLTFALNTLPIAVVYATWSGLGIFLITLLGYLVFEQAMDWRAIVGLLLIVAGVILVNSFAPNK